MEVLFNGLDVLSSNSLKGRKISNSSNKKAFELLYPKTNVQGWRFVDSCNIMLLYTIVGGMDMKGKFYNSLWFKNTILISIPSIVSVIGIFISFVPNNIKIIFGCVSFFLIVCLAVAVIFFANLDEKTHKKLDEHIKENADLKVISYHLKTLAKTNEYTVNAFSEFVEAWSKNINSFADEVIKSGQAPKKCWDKANLFDAVCVQCRNMIKTYCDNDDNTKISVGYVSYKQDGDNEWVNMISHSNPESTRPHAAGKEEQLSECKYHYAELIKNKISDIEIAVNNEEVQRIFNKVSTTTDLNKYTQYIAIPIYCSRKSCLVYFR